MIKILDCKIKKTNSPNYLPGRGPDVKDYWLLLCFDSDFSYYSNGEMKEGTRGQYVLYKPFERSDHTRSSKMSTGHIADFIWFKGPEADELLLDGILPTATAFNVPSLSNLTTQKHIMSIRNAPYLYPDNADHMRSAIITELIVKLKNAYKQSAVNVLLKANESLEKTRSYMFKNFETDITIDILASKAGYSKSRFQYLYRHLYGISPMEDLIKFRIYHAKILLEIGDHTITETSRMCGFSSVHYFSTYFKRIEGITPSRYKANNIDNK